MKSRFIFCIGSLLVSGVLVFGTTNAQDVRKDLFGETDNVIQHAKEKNAHLYSPAAYEKAMEYYNDAESDYKKGRDLEDIRSKLKEARSFLIKAMDGVKLGEVTFSSTMAARNDALSADAPKFSPATWKKAEQQFKSAAEQLEDGDVNDAKSEGGEAERLYRAAELEAIKANYLNPAKALLKQADDMDVKETAPKTLAKAKQLAQKAEALLQQNRYDTDEARQMAQEAKYEAAHAIYLHKTFTAMDKEGKGFEDLRLAAEKTMQRISGSLDLLARFENGLNDEAGRIIQELKTREKKSADQAKTIASLTDENATLKKQVESMTSRVGTLTKAEQDLQESFKRKREEDARIEQVSTMFSDSEGNVLRDENDIIIRLYGLTFGVGKSVIESQYFSLLTKVQQAIKSFPGCQVVIKGHTDSQGSDATNQQLSEQRARAVEEYLRANMGSSLVVSSQGYGESQPIASNDTVEGRAKNRRIDVVIVPEYAPSKK
jgi:OOP family OmpA-OmpF porin